tara:strand:+ start:891 stop:1286 length:396 start_codon:yes stop_codon:yes gene_type:complete
MKNFLWWVVFSIGAVLWIDVSIAHEHNVAEWRQKPIQCSSLYDLKTHLEDNGFVPLLGGIGHVTMDPDDDYLLNIPTVLFWNQEEEWFIIVEFMFGANEACVTSRGAGLNFDVQDMPGMPNAERPNGRRDW